AGLLHDFGKVGVREQVLVKAKKLSPHQLLLIRQRHAFVRRSCERDFWQRRAEFVETHGKKGYEARRHELEAALEGQLTDLDRFLSVVLEANEPSLLPEASRNDLEELAQRTYADPDGEFQPLLSDEEVRYHDSQGEPRRAGAPGDR